MTRRVLALVGALLCVAPDAIAVELPDSSTPTATEAIATPDGSGPPRVHTGAIALSAARLFSGTFEVQYENTLTPSVSLVGIVAGGTGHNGTTDIDLTRVGVGMQARWYALGNFDRGLIVAADVRYEHRTSTYSDSYASLSGVGNGLGVGIWTGGKWLLGERFFCEGGLGGAWAWNWTRVVWGTESQKRATGQLVPIYILSLGLAL